MTTIETNAQIRYQELNAYAEQLVSTRHAISFYNSHTGDIQRRVKTFIERLFHHEGQPEDQGVMAGAELVCCAA